MRCTNIVALSHGGKISIVQCVSLPQQKSSSLNKVCNTWFFSKGTKLLTKFHKLESCLLSCHHH